MTDDLRSTLAATGDAIRTARDEMAGIGDDIEQLEIERDQWQKRAETAEQLNLKLIEQAKEQAATIERVRELAKHPSSSHGRVMNYVQAADVLATLDQPEENR